MNRIQKIMQNAIDSIAEINKKPLFIQNPEHKVRNATIKQLKSILRGRKAITLKKGIMNKQQRKLINTKFNEAEVIWSTEETGLDYFKTIYGQNK